MTIFPAIWFALSKIRGFFLAMMFAFGYISLLVYFSYSLFCDGHYIWGLIIAGFSMTPLALIPETVRIIHIYEKYKNRSFYALQDYDKYKAEIEVLWK